MQLYPRKDSSGGDSTIEMMSTVHGSSNSHSHGHAGHDVDTHKEVYAAPHDHYLGSPNNEPRPRVPENYPELAPHSGLEAVDPDGIPKYGGVIGGAGMGGGGGEGGVFQQYHDSPIPVTAVPASDKKLPPTPNEKKKPWHQNWTIRILIIAVAIIIIVAIVVGAVLGTRNSNDDGDDSADPAETATSTTSAPTSTPTSDPDSEDDLRMGVTYNATFTMYGTGDGSGGTNCTVPQTSCGFTAIPGFTVGVSTNLFTVTNGGGADNPVCGTCWLLETLEDDSGLPFRRNITAIVNEECGGEPDEVCGMETLDDVNPWDGNVNFNLCTDSGARDALFDEGSEMGLAWGRVTRVSCDNWEGETIE